MGYVARPIGCLRSCGPKRVPATRTFDRDPAALARLMSFLSQRLPALAVEPFLVKTCLYTMTPDRDFVIDRLPGRPRIQVLLGSAHAYKFASLPGRVVAERPVRGTSSTDEDLGNFGLGRPALQERASPRSFVV